MTKHFLEQLSQDLEPQRPELRRKDTELNVDAKFGFLMPDLSMLPQAELLKGRSNVTPICIELKVISSPGFWRLLTTLIALDLAKMGILAFVFPHPSASHHQKACMSLLHAPTYEV